MESGEDLVGKLVEMGKMRELGKRERKCWEGLCMN
jgi:hypothetical protein